MWQHEKCRQRILSLCDPLLALMQCGQCQDAEATMSATQDKGSRAISPTPPLEYTQQRQAMSQTAAQLKHDAGTKALHSGNAQTPHTDRVSCRGMHGELRHM